MVNLFIVYVLDSWSREIGIKLTLGNCLFGAVKLTKYADFEKFENSGYSIEFDARLQLLTSSSEFGKNLSFLMINVSVSAKTNKTPRV